MSKEEEDYYDGPSFPDSGTVVGPCKARTRVSGNDGGGVEERDGVKSPNPNPGVLLLRRRLRQSPNPNRIRDDPNPNPNRSERCGFGEREVVLLSWEEIFLLLRRGRLFCEEGG